MARDGAGEGAQAIDRNFVRASPSSPTPTRTRRPNSPPWTSRWVRVARCWGVQVGVVVLVGCLGAGVRQVQTGFLM